MFDKLLSFATNDTVGIIMIFILIGIVFWGMYNKIKFLCLEKASEMVAEAEKHSELSGEEKFALCILWINESLPKIFRNSLIQTIIKKLINFAYNTSFDYMRNYIKRKTGYDIAELVDQYKQQEVNMENN